MDYKEILKGIVDIINTTEKSDIGFANICTYIGENCPELKESEDERVRKELIKHLKELSDWKEDEVIPVKNPSYYQQWASWLEKQGDKCLVNFDEAEKEKYDFVSGQFIECRKSFNEFKEDNSYWLEYIGDDNYIGRSDNILNQKFHITPRQLFTLFTWQHRPKEDCNVNDEANAPTGYGKYVDECLNEAAKHFFSDGEDAYSVADLFYAGVRCGKSWLEKQSEQKEYTFKSLPRLLDMIEPTSKAKAYCQKLIDTLVKERYSTDAKIVGECLKKMNDEDVPMAIMDEKQGEQKPEENKGNIGEISPNWSEEDEINVYNIIHFLEEPSMLENNEPCKKIVIDWLKSLRHQNRWKPSDEQMEALKYVVNLMASSESPKENDYYYNVFKDLRKQLKKLMENSYESKNCTQNS